jgi:hypothetical protein
MRREVRVGYMNKPRIPEQFYSETSHYFGAMKIVGASLGKTTAEIEAIMRLLPQHLKETIAFVDRFSNIWRYDFGEPYLSDKKQPFMIGTDQFPPVERLLFCVDVMQRVLTPAQLLGYLARLENPSKHLETLMECAPLLLLVDPATVNYEVSGLGEGGHTIDFQIVAKSGDSLLIDVKCRVGQVPQKAPKLGKPDACGLLKSLPEKFCKADPSIVLQGGWIQSVLKYDEPDVIREFKRTDPSRLHFIILANWVVNAYVIARNDNIKRRVLQIFRLPSVDSIVTKCGI